MDYTELFTPHHVALLADWLVEKSELQLQIELPHSGGGGTFQTVRSLAEIKHAIKNIHTAEVEILVWKIRTLAEAESDAAPPEDLAWIYAHSAEVMYFSVRKNRNSYASYTGDPGRYTRALDEWLRGRTIL